MNFTSTPQLIVAGDETAAKFGLYTAQGGVERPRISAVLNGLLLMLSRGQIDESTLFDATYETVGLEPDPTVKQQIQEGVRVCA